MTPDVLNRCQALGIRVMAKDGRLHVKAPKELLTPQINAELKENKQAVIDYLTSQDEVLSLPRSPTVPRLSEGESGNFDCQRSEDCQSGPVGNVGELGTLGNLQNEDYEERAAIAEYGGGLCPDAAEKLARAICNDAVTELWAFISPEGRILADSDFSGKADAWRIGLGWPDKEEIAAAKSAGYRVERVQLIRDKNQPD